MYEIYKSNCLSFAASKSIESNGAEGGEGVSACKVVKKKNKAKTEVQNTTATQTDTSG